MSTISPTLLSLSDLKKGLPVALQIANDKKFLHAVYDGNLKAIKEIPFVSDDTLKEALLVVTESAYYNKLLFNELFARENVDLNYFYPDKHSTNNHGGSSVLMEAAKSGNIEIVKALLNHKKIDLKAKDQGNKALKNAAWAGHAHIVEELLKQKDIDVNYLYQGSTPLLVASNIETVQVLLDNEKIDLKFNTQGNKKLLDIIKDSNLEKEKLVGIFLASGKLDLKHENIGQKVFFEAARYGLAGIIKMLLPHFEKNGISINFVDPRSNKTPFMIATEYSSNSFIDTIRELVNYKGIDLQFHDQGRKALLAVVSKDTYGNNRWLVEALLSNKTIQGVEKAIEIAANNNNEKTARLLVKFINPSYDVVG